MRLSPRIVVGVLAAMLVIGAVFAGGWYWSASARARAGDTPKPAVADIGFSQDMITHHHQAVLMAMMAMTRATPAVRPIAQSILRSQSKQIGVMRGWLQAWGAPLANPHPMAWMQDSMSGMGQQEQSERLPSSMPMPGMASSKQLAKLWQARGKAFDILFMQLMTRHHEGGVLMARDAEQLANLDYVREAARGIVYEQYLEIGEMKARLNADGSRPLPSLPGLARKHEATQSLR